MIKKVICFLLKCISLNTLRYIKHWRNIDSLRLLQIARVVWVNRYRWNKWTQRTNLKSWAILFEFYFSLMTYRNTWIDIFFPSNAQIEG